MASFFEAVLAYPTVFFSGALCVVLMYWAMVIVGIFDIDILDFDLDFLDSIEGAGEALDGALDGAGEAMDGALDGAAEAADGAAEAAEGASEASEGFDPGSTGILASLVNALKLRSVPLTITISFMTLTGWLTSFILMAEVAPHLAQVNGVLVAGFAMLLSLFVGVLVTSVLVRPLAPVFESQQGSRRADFVGTACEVTTSRVDGRFGQAELDDGGAGLVVQIRCDHDNGLRKGATALVVSFDEEREAFVVEPFSNERAKALSSERTSSAKNTQRRKQGGTT